MKNVNYLVEKCQKMLRIKFVPFMAIVLSFNLGYSQQPSYNYNQLFTDCRDDYTNANSWAFSIDDDLSGEFKGGAFSWFFDGGKNIDDLGMCLRRSNYNNTTYELWVPSVLNVNNMYNRGDTSTHLSIYTRSEGSYIESNGANKVTLGDSNDDVAINSKNLILDYGGANDLAQVSINAGNPVNGVALTVGGKTYIGESKNIETHPEIGSDLKEDCSLFVEKQILASDLNIIPKPNWKDSVFEKDYKKMDLNALENFVKENKHLPGIVSEKEVNEKGYKIHAFNEGILQNVEELLLHIIDQNKKIEELNKKIELLEKSR